jgi:hypothetical protein
LLGPDFLAGRIEDLATSSQIQDDAEEVFKRGCGNKALVGEFVMAPLAHEVAFLRNGVKVSFDLVERFAALGWLGGAP